MSARCGKRRYRDRVGALFALSQHQGDRAPLRAYVCPHCHAWHLTSQTKREGDSVSPVVDSKSPAGETSCLPKGV